MFVAKRTFRNYGQMIAPGSIVEPGTVKRLKSLLGDGHVVEVTEHNFPEWQEYFKVRHGVTITLGKPVVKPIVDKTEPVKTETAKTTKPTTKVTTKVSSK